MMKKLTRSTLTLLAVIALVASANAVTYFSDNYTVTNGGGGINYQYDNGIRQSGTAAPLQYVLWADAPEYVPYVTNAGFSVDTLYTPCDSTWVGQVIFSPDHDFTEAGNFTVEAEFLRTGQSAPADWIAFNILKGATLGNLWNDPGMNFMFYPHGLYNFFDGWQDNAPIYGGDFLELAYASNPVLKVKYVVSQPSGFPPSGDTHVALFINDTAYPVSGINGTPLEYIYTHEGGFSNNYLAIFSPVDLRIDNFKVISCSGIPTSSAWNNDADSGISSTKTYTHAVNFATDATTTVNGVDFIGSGTALPQSGPNWYYNNISLGLGAYAISMVGETPNVTGAGAGLVTDCLIDATTDGCSAGELTLTGLTPGQEYILNLYGIGLVWNAPNGRSNYFATSDGGIITVLDQSEFGADNGQIVRYNYTAPANGIFSITAAPVLTNAGGVYCWYAFSNELIPEPAIFALLGLLGLAFFRSK